MWSLYENEKELKPLVFSNGKSQADIVKEVIEAVEQGYKIIFIRGMCGTGKSAIALNLARKLGRTSIVVPIKSLQEQYKKDYSGETGKKQILLNGKNLRISSIVGRQNFKCRYLQENDIKFESSITREENAKLTEIFYGAKPIETMEFSKSNSEKDDSCDNIYLPCKIEIKEKNLPKLKQYLKQNPDVNLSDFSTIKDIKRMSIAPVCHYWSPIIPSEIEIYKFRDEDKIYYQGLNNKKFTIYQRKPGCPYYDQHQAYAESDVLIFNSLKYKLETLLDRKPATELEIIDECDEFLDSFANQEQLDLNRLLFSLSNLFAEKQSTEKIIQKLISLTKELQKTLQPSEEIYELKNTLLEQLLSTYLENPDLLYEIEAEELSYINHLDKVARIFEDFFNETFYSVEKKENNLIVSLVTTNLEKRFKEMTEKNKIFVMMSGTIHSEEVLRNIFGLNNFKIIEAEIKPQGELIKCRYGYEMNCKYENFKADKNHREKYLLSFSKAVASAKPPTLVHLTSFSDLPTKFEKQKYNLDNLPTQQEIINQQEEDPFGQRIIEFKDKKTKILFTTKCSRGIDFPGEICNSIILTRFPYPNISSIFWKILKRTNPEHFMSFYLDKANRELLQKVYRGLRSKTDRVYLLSPDIRVLDFDIE